MELFNVIYTHTNNPKREKHLKSREGEREKQKAPGE